MRDVPEGGRIVTVGEKATSAYFILEGETAAGVPEDAAATACCATMEAGDFFGEIAALTGSPRTADVVSVVPTIAPGGASNGAARDDGEPGHEQAAAVDTLSERLSRTNNPDLPRLATMDQAALRDLRTAAPTVEALPRSYAEG